MSRESLVIFAGLLVFFVPSVGVPEEWKTYILMACGVVLMLLGYLLRRAAYYRSLDQGNGERAADSFVESSKRSDRSTYSEELIV